MKKAVAYVRVSTGDQDYKYQKDVISDYCIFKKFDLVETFSDKQSGLKTNRTGLLEMMDYIKHNPVDCIVITELSRLGRTSDVLNKIKEFDNLKICLHSIKEPIITLDDNGNKSSMGNLLVTVLSGINELELDTMKFRFKSGAEKKAIEGGYGGGRNISYGYKVVNKMLVVDDEEAESVRMIYNLYLKGTGIAKIAEYLNKNNVPTKWKLLSEKKEIKSKYSYKWFESAVYRLLRNKLYVGIRTYKNKEYPQPQLRIIDDETFTKTNERITSQNAKYGTHRKYTYLLSKKVYCGNCGHPFYAYKKDSDLAHARYICLSNRYKFDVNKCINTSVQISRLEDLVYKVILHRLKDELLSNIDVDDILNQIDIIKQDILDLNESLETIKKEKNILIRYSIKGLVNEDELAEQLKPINSQEQQITNTINIKEEQLKALSISHNNLKDIKKLRLEYIKEGKTIPASIVNTIISKIVITKQTTNIPAIFTNKQDRVVEVNIISALKEHKYLISQRTDIIYDINGPDGFTCNKFLQYDTNFNEALYSFLTTDI